MIKKLLMMSASLLLLLTLGFAVIPAHVAHADACTGSCGPDPVVARCTSSQYVVAINHFFVNGQQWAIRLMSTTSTSSACDGEEWASLILTSGNNPNLFNSIDITVFSRSRDPETGSCTLSEDTLFSSSFGSGAYTNMIASGNRGSYAQYDGNSQDPRASTGTIAC